MMKKNLEGVNNALKNQMALILTHKGRNQFAIALKATTKTQEGVDSYVIYALNVKNIQSKFIANVMIMPSLIVQQTEALSVAVENLTFS